MIDDLASWYSLYLIDADSVEQAISTVFRLRCNNDPAWLWKMIDERPGDVVDIGMSAGRIVVDGIAYPPASMSWFDWVSAVRDVDSINWNAKPINFEILLTAKKGVVTSANRLTRSNQREQAILF